MEPEKYPPVCMVCREQRRLLVKEPIAPGYDLHTLWCQTSKTSVRLVQPATRTQ